MTRRSERVTVKLTPQRKERWEEYAESESDYENLSDLVRLAVQKEMTGALDREAVEELDISMNTESLKQTVETAMGDITTDLESIQTDIAEIQNEIKHNDDVQQLADDLAGQLPRTNSPDEFFDRHYPANPNTRDLPEFDQETGIEKREIALQWSTPEAWAAYLNESVGEVRRALERAREYYPDVQVFEHTWNTTSSEPTGDLAGRRYYHLPDGYETEESK